MGDEDPGNGGCCAGRKRGPGNVFHTSLPNAALWDPDIPGAYLGLRRRHGRAHLMRAALEGVCMQIRLIVDRLEEVHPVREVRATGGVFRSSLWQQTMAGMLARPIHIVGDAEGSALGAAALGLFALGLAPTLAQAVTDLWARGGCRSTRSNPTPGWSRSTGNSTSTHPPPSSKA